MVFLRCFAAPRTKEDDFSPPQLKQREESGSSTSPRPKSSSCRTTDDDASLPSSHARPLEGATGPDAGDRTSSQPCSPAAGPSLQQAGVMMRANLHPSIMQGIKALTSAGCPSQVVSNIHMAWCPPAQLVHEVHDLHWVGQGSQGVVYEGTWQGASVAVKWSVAEQLDAGAYELLFSRLLGHPNVVQTYDAKVSVLDQQTLEMDPDHPSHGGSSRQHVCPKTETGLHRSDSFKSDEGFGDPYGNPSSFTDVRSMLHLIGAKPGHCITQLVMEYCDQGSLLTAISRGIFLPTSKFGPKVTLRALLRTAREVAQGMLHLHQAHVVHGDLKPANVLLMNSRKDRRGFVAKVSDFGLAQYCPTSAGVANAPWGTLVFMAPERIRCNLLGPASDVWSFGVMLWQMYTAKLPYEGTRQAELLQGITDGMLHLQWPADSPEALVSLAAHCMAPSPSQRPTFEALAAGLARMENNVRLQGVRISDAESPLQLNKHCTRSLDLRRAAHALGVAGAQPVVGMGGGVVGGSMPVTPSRRSLPSPLRPNEAYAATGACTAGLRHNNSTTCVVLPAGGAADAGATPAASPAHQVQPPGVHIGSKPSFGRGHRQRAQSALCVPSQPFAPSAGASAGAHGSPCAGLANISSREGAVGMAGAAGGSWYPNAATAQGTGVAAGPTAASLMLSSLATPWQLPSPLSLHATQSGLSTLTPGSGTSTPDWQLVGTPGGVATPPTAYSRHSSTACYLPRQQALVGAAARMQAQVPAGGGMRERDVRLQLHTTSGGDTPGSVGSPRAAVVADALVKLDSDLPADSPRGLGLAADAGACAGSWSLTCAPAAAR